MRRYLCAPQDDLEKAIRRGEICMRKRSLIIVLLALSVGFISANAKASITIATFADPSRNSSRPLFTVNFLNGTLSGGWAQGNTGLTLQIPYSGNTYSDAWFEMDTVSITDTSAMAGQTDEGVINFYKNGPPTAVPLLVVSFENGSVSRYGFGADDAKFIANNVTITGSEIAGTLSEEEFSFSFVNLAKLQGHTSWNDGFTSTAAFTSSAVKITNHVPEPATICVLGLGALSLVRRKKNA
jgi:PEP-CTERM motif